MLVEVSLEGGRLSLSGSSAFVVEQPVMVRIGGFGNVQARVRWAGEGFVGLRFDAPLHNAELDLLLQACRPEFAQDSTMRAYGK